MRNEFAARLQILLIFVQFAVHRLLINAGLFEVPIGIEHYKSGKLTWTYTVMPLRVIGVSLFPVWKWNRGQLLFNAKEIESASCEAENC